MNIWPWSKFKEMEIEAEWLRKEHASQTHLIAKVIERVNRADDLNDKLERRIADFEGAEFQRRVEPWMLECFGEEISKDAEERNDRFIEEALELIQACDGDKERCHKLVDYVFGRPIGEKGQEVGGVMVTLAALCLAQGLNMHSEGDRELVRIWSLGIIDKIRDKQKRKIYRSPLPLPFQPPAPPPDRVK